MTCLGIMYIALRIYALYSLTSLSLLAWQPSPALSHISFYRPFYHSSRFAWSFLKIDSKFWQLERGWTPTHLIFQLDLDIMVKLLTLTYTRPKKVSPEPLRNESRASLSEKSEGSVKSGHSGNSGSSAGIPESLTFDNIINGGTCPVSRPALT
jgi:hypothetical protein